MRLCFLLFLIFLLCPITLAQTTSLPNSDIQSRADRLDVIAEDLTKDTPDLIALRDLIRDIQRSASIQTAPLRDEFAEVSSDLDRLGPAPEDGQPAEAKAISLERERLKNELSNLNGLIKKSDLNMVEADRLLEEIAQMRRDDFSSNIFAQSKSILSPNLWKEAALTFQTDISNTFVKLGSWRDEKINSGDGWTTFATIVFAALVALACFLPVRKRLRQLLEKRLVGVKPLGSRKILVLTAYTIVRVLPALVGGFFFYHTLNSVGVISAEAKPLAQSIWLGFVVLVLVDGAATGMLTPHAPKWRITQLQGVQPFKLRALVFLVASVLIIERIVLEGIQLSGEGEALTNLIIAIATIILAVVLFLLSQSSLWYSSAKDDQPAPSLIWIRIRFVGKALSVIALLAVLFGYLSLGHYIVSSTFYLVALGAIIWVIRSGFREIIRLFDTRFTNPEDAKTDQESVLFYWIGFGVDVVAFLIFVPPALLVLGAEWADVRDGIIDAFVGFKIGEFNFSILKILTAIGFFILLLSITRFVQRTAETRIFPKSRIDSGVQNSLKTLIGYVGLIIAFLVAVSSVGFNLANLAIIAGALSIGIGFGLQSIVSNFVSGLILLFERPIKVGDWIVTASGEGFVKKISVRSTEIETFDKASVIVPNSELISSAVTNWNHKDNIGRVVIPVGVSYNADPEIVMEILEEVARENRGILNFPEPSVYFADFADSSLNFELRGFISDVKSTIKIRSELRVAIFKKLKQANIEIPYPQRDLHMKSGE